MVAILEEPNNKRYFHKNKIDFPKENHFIVSLHQYGRHEHSMFSLVPFLNLQFTSFSFLTILCAGYKAAKTEEFIQSTLNCKFLYFRSDIFLVVEEGGFSQMKVTAICSPMLLVSCYNSLGFIFVLVYLLSKPYAKDTV